MTTRDTGSWNPAAVAACDRLIALHAKLNRGKTKLSNEAHAARAGFGERQFRRWMKKEHEPKGQSLKGLVSYLDEAAPVPKKNR